MGSSEKYALFEIREKIAFPAKVRRRETSVHLRNSTGKTQPGKHLKRTASACGVCESTKISK